MKDSIYYLFCLAMIYVLVAFNNYRIRQNNHEIEMMKQANELYHDRTYDLILETTKAR